MIISNYAVALTFQSTPPRRRRPLNSPSVAVVCHFNPRLREGGDTPQAKHTPLWAYFNPRLREGGDDYILSKYPDFVNFNPRLREGGDVVCMESK